MFERYGIVIAAMIAGFGIACAGLFWYPVMMMVVGYWLG